MKKYETLEIHNNQYLNTLKNAKTLCDLRTLGIERKGFIKHALEWAIEKHEKQQTTEKHLLEIETDINRFLILMFKKHSKHKDNKLNIHELHEYNVLYKKLVKVGKEW